MHWGDKNKVSKWRNEDEMKTENRERLGNSKGSKQAREPVQEGKVREREAKVDFWKIGKMSASC